MREALRASLRELLEHRRQNQYTKWYRPGRIFDRRLDKEAKHSYLKYKITRGMDAGDERYRGEMSGSKKWNGLFFQTDFSEFKYYDYEKLIEIMVAQYQGQDTVELYWQQREIEHES